jgi:chaperone required for assembly of F1-ATPase
MDNRLLNQFNNLYTITNNPSDVIPYKYFTNSFNGIQLHKIDMLLEKINLYKSTVNYINNDNIIINRIITKQYLLNNNNSYHKQFIDNYTNKDKFKLISIVGIIEKNSQTNIHININNNSSQNNTTPNEQINIIDNIINQLQNNITLLQTLKNNINNENDNIGDIDLALLIENTIKQKSLSN